MVQGLSKVPFITYIRCDLPKFGHGVLEKVFKSWELVHFYTLKPEKVQGELVQVGDQLDHSTLESSNGQGGWPP